VSDWEVALIVALLSGGFAITGVLASDWLARRREDRQFRTTTAVELAEAEQRLYGDNWLDLTVQLERQETQLAIAQTPEDLIKALREISEMCWYDGRESYERFGPDIGIRTEFLDARRSVNRAIAAHLLRSGSKNSRHQLRSAAVSSVRRIASDPANREYRSARAQEEDEAAD
jgi:hypothetical protein